MQFFLITYTPSIDLAEKKTLNFLTFCLVFATIINMKTKKNTEFVILTEMWKEGKYLDVGEIIFSEEWDRAKLAEFCAYFAKYLGLSQLNILYKFL